MSFGQLLLERERSGNPVESMWIVFSRKVSQQLRFWRRAVSAYADSTVVQHAAGIAHRSDDLTELAAKIGLPTAQFSSTLERFNEMSRAGYDPDFRRGQSAYDRYYGDPTVTPNPNSRALDKAPFYAVKMALSDLGTCGGLRANDRARASREDGTVIVGLYAIGNTAANAFGSTYPGAGATIAQGLFTATSRPGTPPKSDQSGSSASAFFSISYQKSGVGQGVLSAYPYLTEETRRPPRRGSLIIVRASSRSLA